MTIFDFQFGISVKYQRKYFVSSGFVILLLHKNIINLTISQLCNLSKMKIEQIQSLELFQIVTNGICQQILIVSSKYTAAQFYKITWSGLKSQILDNLQCVTLTY
ncbi:Hypothetical_protein [Hexamita inflata]|uniref:Hypothetical_protein n=1 Tax=Hexamita inflata TaxID=28002 RepID=A0AA86NXZ2_9EUKA|nr:Hypothetical protein HINF_LOCUS15664 [Hexamita inflata]